MTIPIYAIVAVAQNNVIGKEGGMPWHLSTDLKRFKSLTGNKPIIMGRKTWESIGRPLPRRSNIVITRQPPLCSEQQEHSSHQASSEGPFFVKTIEAAVERARADAIRMHADSIFVIGGGAIYAHMLPMFDKIFMTKVLADVDGDTYFPELKDKDWQKGEVEYIPAGEKDSFPTEFFVLSRLRNC